jgi:hypothetical protein
MNRILMRIPPPSPPVFTIGGIALSDSEKGEALTDILEAQFLPVKERSEPAVIEVVDKVMKAYCFAPVY